MNDKRWTLLSLLHYNLLNSHASCDRRSEVPIGGDHRPFAILCIFTCDNCSVQVLAAQWLEYSEFFNRLQFPYQVPKSYQISEKNSEKVESDVLFNVMLMQIVLNEQIYRA